jgi:hypothetical protein
MCQLALLFWALAGLVHYLTGSLLDMSNCLPIFVSVDSFKEVLPEVELPVLGP